MNRLALLLIGTIFILLLVFVLFNILNSSTQEESISTKEQTYKLVPLPRNADKNATTTDPKPTKAIEEPPIVPEPKFIEYLEITTGCAITTDSTCVRAYANTSTSSSERAKLRIGTVLEIGSSTTSDGTKWYEIVFNEPLRYEERVALPWYVLATSGITHRLKAPADLNENTPSTTKSLLVDRSEQTMTAYEGSKIIRTYTISTGLELSPTPRGVFTVYRMTPSRYMQGPIIGINTKYYDLPGVPWNLYFTKQGAVVHGAYWHNSFGRQYSSGCVNIKPSEAKELYDWAELGMTITVRD